MRFKSSSKHHISPEQEATAKLMRGKVNVASIARVAQTLSSRKVIPTAAVPNKERK